MQSVLEFSIHANQRRLERRAPSSVVKELQTTAPRFAGHSLKGHRVEYRLVRHSDTFWISPVMEGRAATIYAVEAHEIRAWAMRYLLNPEQNVTRLLRLTNHRTPTELLTEELAVIWLSQEPVQERCQVRA